MSVTDTVAVREPVADGVKVTLMLQLCPAPTLLPQVLVCLKSPELVPVIAMLEMPRVVFPRFLSVKVCGPLVCPTLMLPKFRLGGEN